MHRRTLLLAIPMALAACVNEASPNAPDRREIAEAFARTVIPEATGEEVPFEEAVEALFARANELVEGDVTFIANFGGLPDGRRRTPVTFGWFDESAFEILLEICSLADTTFRLRYGQFEFGTAEDAFFQDPSWESMRVLPP